MITTERLEELVNQEATAWGCDGKSVFDLPLKSTKDRIVAFVGKCCLVVDWYAGKSKGWLTAHYNLGQLYETEERAKWALRTIGKRIEKFEPPMWEDIWKDMQAYYKFCFTVNEQYYCFTVDTFGIDIYIDGIDTIFHKPPTEENYEKACKIVRDLFKEDK